MCGTRPKQLVLAMLLLLLGGAGFAAGQFRRNRNDVVVELQRLEATGKIHSTSRGLIRMITDDGQTWEVYIGDQTLVEVRGQGGVEMLSPGVCVRFEAPMAGRRAIQGEISELTVFSPSDGFGLGIRPASDEAGAHDALDEPGERQEPEAPAGQQPEQPAVVAPEIGGDSDQTDKLPGGTVGVAAKELKKARRSFVRPTKGRFLIAGQVRSLRKGTLSLVAGRDGPIKARVAKEAKVTLYSSDYSVARPGDTITHLTGTYNRPGRALAKKLVIEVAGTELAAEEQESRRRRPGARSRHPRREQAPLDGPREETAPRKKP